MLPAGIGAPAENQPEIMFDSCMTGEEFSTWLKSKGVSDRDCDTLTGKLPLHVWPRNHY